MVRRFRYYLDESLVKKRVPNKEEARSLMAKAIKRLEYLKAQRIDRSIDRTRRLPLVPHLIME